MNFFLKNLSLATLAFCLSVSAAFAAGVAREINWQEACPVGASPNTRCGEMLVPERRGVDASQTIRVPIAVISAPDQNSKAKDPFLFLMGGTGGGYGVLQDLAPLAYVMNRDVIVVEQRGNPMATPALTCPSVGQADPLKLIYNSAVKYEGVASAQKCRDEILSKGVDIQAYTTPFAARDLIDLRVSLGIDKWNVFGVSYGGRVGTTLMRLDGESIRTLILDSAQITGTWFSSWERLKAVGDFFERCASAAHCGVQYPSLRADFERTIARLSQKPAGIERAGKRERLTASGYLHLVVWSLYQLGLDQTTRVPAAITAAAEGDYRQLLSINSMYPVYEPEKRPSNEGYTKDSSSNAQQVSMLCAEEFPFNQDVNEEALALAAGWSATTANLLTEIEVAERKVCADWGFKPDLPEQAEPPVGDRPTLMLYAGHDTIAPPSHGEIALSSLSNAQLVVFPWTAHAVLYQRQVCSLGMVRAFIEAPEAALDLSCVEGIQEPVWVPRQHDGSLELMQFVAAHAANSVAKFGLPGRSVRVVAPELGIKKTIASNGFLSTTSQPFTGSEPFRVASQTKTYTAVAVLRLVEQGIFDIDAPIDEVLSSETLGVLEEGGYQPERITVRQLLQHTAGFPDYAMDPEYQQEAAASPTRRWTREEQIRWGALRMEQVGDPGAQYHYSDTGYILLGEIIERASNLEMAEAIRRLLRYDDLGLSHTWFETLEAVPEGLEKRIAQYVGPNDVSLADPSFDLYGGGGIVSTIEDVTDFYRALLKGDVFESAETLELMLKVPAVSQSQNGDGYALGIVRSTVDGMICYGHSGFFGSSTFHCPEADLTVSSNRYNAFVAPTYNGDAALRTAIEIYRLSR